MVVGFDKANPETHQWYLTPPKEDAWKFLEKHRLTRDLFFSLWENEEVEIQKKTKKGEWEDVFVYTTALQTKTGSDTSD